jgi:hypothetical protein
MRLWHNGVIDRSAARHELTFSDAGLHGDEQIRALSFSGQNQMTLSTMQFDFTLVAPTAARQTAFTYIYNLLAKSGPQGNRV